jgi:diaminohydroxyphosphoribosylaminopyrimidine deaminase/5-amino-6-(5-phosphoribosylamino)uracil reductase
MVGAVLVKARKIIGRGWHRRAGEPHAEIEALQDAIRQGRHPRGATLFVTLEPCCTHGRTPPCTKAILAAGIRRVVVGAIDPNPHHAGKGLTLLRRAGIEAELIPNSSLNESCETLNEAFNHWIVHRTPFVTVKAAMTLDGKIATASGESKWITGENARACGMKLRAVSDAILVGVNTVLTDDPSLTVRPGGNSTRKPAAIRRIILDSVARTPLHSKVVTDALAKWTTIVVSPRAPKTRVRALAKLCDVQVSPAEAPAGGGLRRGIPLRWLLRQLGQQSVTQLLVEGGGEVNAAFLLGGFAQRVAFFYAPKILGGRDSRRAVAGEGAARLSDVIRLRDLKWSQLGGDFLLEAAVDPIHASSRSRQT